MFGGAFRVARSKVPTALQPETVWQVYRLQYAILLAIVGSYVVGTQAFGNTVDWSVYTRYYNVYLFGGREYYQLDPAFRLLFSIFAFFRLHLQYVLSILVFVSLLIKLLVLTSLSRSSLPATFYLFALFGLHEYTQVRVAFALSFIYLFVWLMERGHRVRILWVIAPFFHMSTLVFAAVVVMCRPFREKSFWFKVGVCTGFIVALAGSLHLVSAVFSSSNLVNYLNGYDSGRVPKVFSITNMIFATYSVLLIRIGVHRWSKASELIVLATILAIPAIFAFYSEPVLSDRFKEFFFAFSPISFALALRRFRRTPAMILLVVSFVLFSLSSTVVYINNGIYPSLKPYALR